MADLMQQARELLAAEWRKLNANAPADELVAGCELPPLIAASVAAITAALRAASEVEALSESDKEIALAQAVELAQYVEKNAKGGMREAAARFLSLSYARHVAQRLRAAPEGCVLVPVQTLESIRDSSTDPNARGFAAGALAARPQGVNNG